MSIQISIPLDRLESNPALADALSALVNAMRASPVSPSALPVARQRTPQAAPAKAKAPTAPAISKGIRQPRATRRAAPRSKAAPAGPAPPAVPFEEQGGQRRFLDLLRKRRSITSTEAMKVLGVKGRALGSLVGNVVLAARRRGARVPFTSRPARNGGRIYTYGKQGSAPTPPAPSTRPTARARAVAQPPARGRTRRQPAADRRHPPSAKAAPRAKPRAEPPKAPPAFEDAAKRFLDLIRERGSISSPEAMKALGLPGRAFSTFVANLIGAARRRGEQAPFTSRPAKNGGRIYTARKQRGRLTPRPAPAQAEPASVPSDTPQPAAAPEPPPAPSAGTQLSPPS